MKQLSLFLSLVLSLLLISIKGPAQISNYSFSKSTGNTYTSIYTTGTSVSLGDDADVKVSIGFYFFYNNHYYDSLNIGSNGYIAFGNHSATRYINDLNNTGSGYEELVAPFWNDLNPSAGGHIYYQTTGSSPNRKLIVEYSDVPRYHNSATLNVQVVLYESSNNIEFCYGYYGGSFLSASIGINESPGGSSHFISVTPGNPPTTSTTTSNNSISLAPAEGTNYLFTFNGSSCLKPANQSVSNITVNSADLSWVDPVGSYWDVYVTSHGGSAPVQGTTPTANDVTSTTYSWSEGTASTSYDWYVRKDCDQNNIGTSSWIGPSTFTTNNGKPANPSPANNSVGWVITSKTLDWDDVAGASGYHISIGTTSGGTDIVNNLSTSTSSYTKTSNWSKYTKYYWKITTDYSSASGPAQVSGNEWNFITEYETSSTISGKTSYCSPVFNRPSDASPPYATSVKVFYDKYSFTVPATGRYGIIADWTGVDGFIHLYHDSFDPANPLTNCMVGNDDYNQDQSKSRISYITLNLGTTYYVVGSSYQSYKTGEGSYYIIGADVASMPSATDYNGEPYRSYTIPATDGTTRISDYGCLDANGWTTYYDNNGTQFDFSDDTKLLSIKKNGSDLGSVSVKLAGNSGASHITNPQAPYVSSWGGWWVFNRYWELTPDNQPTTDVTVKYYYTEADFTALKTAITNSGGTPPNSEVNMSCFKINNITGNYDPNPANGHSGVPLAQSCDGDGCWVYTNGSQASTTKWLHNDEGSGFSSMEYVIKHFSGGGGGAAQHTGSGNGSPTPIDLLSFDVVSTENENTILWKTATEENVNYFEIERLNPLDSSISIIGRTQAAGNSNTIQSYSMADQESLSKAYYRLIEMDFDGKKTTFEWHYAERQITDFKLIGLYPNPAQSVLNIDLYSAAPANGIIQILDISGRMIMEQKIELLQNNQSFKIDVNNLASGSYYITIETPFSRINRLFLKF